MCLIIFAHQPSSQDSFVLAANRDELFSRPSIQAQFWQEEHSGIEVLSGRDGLAGGTWVGATPAGRFAAVTNIRDPRQSEKKPKSRGELTLNFLTSEQSPQRYCESLKNSFGDYAGFNLIVGDGKTLCYANNSGDIIEELPPGIYGLSNGVLNSPWPKILNGKSLLVELLSKDKMVCTDDLIDMMNQREKANDDDLPNTGIPLELERRLSPAFILNPERDYGTLCSTALVLRYDGKHFFSEQNYNAEGLPTERHYFEF